MSFVSKCWTSLICCLLSEHLEIPENGVASLENGVAAFVVVGSMAERVNQAG